MAGGFDYQDLLDPLGFGRDAKTGQRGDPGQQAATAWGKLNGTNQGPDRLAQQGLGQTGAANQSDVNFGGTRGMQMSLIQQLQDQAAGRGPSLAQMQLQQGTDRNISQAMALGQSQRGAGAAGALKGIQGQQANIAQGMAGDAAMLRLQEQMAAQNALGGQLNSTRGQDLQNNQFNASQGNTLMNNNSDRQMQLAIAQQKREDEQSAKSSPMGMIGGLFTAL